MVAVTQGHEAIPVGECTTDTAGRADICSSCGCTSCLFHGPCLWGGCKAAVVCVTDHDRKNILFPGEPSKAHLCADCYREEYGTE